MSDTLKYRYLRFVLHLLSKRKWNNGALTEDIEKVLQRAEDL